MPIFSLKASRQCAQRWRTRSWEHLGSLRRRLSTDEQEKNVSKVGKKASSSDYAIAAVTSLAFCIGASAYIRNYRHQKLQELNWNCFQGRDHDELIEIMERNGLMGDTRSVKDELDFIQAWHTTHGYRGGLTLRDLTQKLYVDREQEEQQLSEATDNYLEDLVVDPMRLARRECYYLYYEIKGNGHIRQEIFCRGTTLAVDILTCLSFWMVHDEELDCRVHLGFRNHADRILKDILPLLAPGNDKRATVEISGHSLGGAVAFILAAKLKKRGFNIVRVTSLAAPRFCATQSAAQSILADLPKDTLRIENDTDIVTYIPPFGHGVGDKLYLLNSSRDLVYIPHKACTEWADSIFLNFRLPELLLAWGRPHRVPKYVELCKETFRKTPQSSSI